jgi:hypothetical protein
VTGPARIAFRLQPEHADYQWIHGVVAEAESAGVDYLHLEHAFPLTEHRNGKHFEC